MMKGMATPLDRPLYSTYEAARLLQLHGQTLKRWLEGGRVSGTFYAPVVRSEPKGRDEVTWGEFVEAGLLKEYRGKVSLQHLRTMVEGFRQKYDVPFPLAHFKPLVDISKRKLVVGVTEGTVENVHTQQLQWQKAAENFLEKVDFDAHGVAARLLPRGKRSPIVIDPEVTFGIPQIRGIRTETLMEEFASGEPIAAISETWDLQVPDVEAALQFEASLRPAKAA
jgi:uncharacterized protein (DUF433 family)